MSRHSPAFVAEEILPIFQAYADCSEPPAQRIPQIVNSHPPEPDGHRLFQLVLVPSRCPRPSRSPRRIGHPLLRCATPFAPISPCEHVRRIPTSHGFVMDCAMSFNTTTRASPFFVTDPGRTKTLRLISGVSKRHLADAIATVVPDDVRLVPVSVVGNLRHDAFAIPHCLRAIDCLDETKSDFIKWTERDERPDRLGEYRAVTKLVIDPGRIPPAVHMFRLAHWPVVMIVSDVVKAAMEKAGCAGAKFEGVR
jgi:hypothetical protein